MERKFDSISAKIIKSRYYDVMHLHFFINDKELDELLEKADPGKNYLGLVPTLLSWLDEENERKFVWESAKLEENVSKIFPILMCPDDCDFSCTIILAEVFSNGDSIYWKRIGLDARENILDSFGSKVKWINNIGSFVFRKNEYIRCLKIFEEALDKEIV